MSYGRGAAGVQGRSPRLIFGVTGLENVDFNNSRSLRGVCIPFLPAGWEIKHAASDHVSTKTKSDVFDSRAWTPCIKYSTA